MDSPELWSPAARETHAAAVDRVRVALDRHAAAIGEADRGDALEASATELEAALAALSEAEQALTGAAAFWLDLEDGDPDADGGATAAAEQSDPIPDGVVPVTADLQLTMDVTDAARLYSLARELDPATPINSIADAIFVVSGQLGWDQLLADQVDGITMQGATVQLAMP